MGLVGKAGEWAGALDIRHAPSMVAVAKLCQVFLVPPSPGDLELACCRDRDMLVLPRLNGVRASWHFFWRCDPALCPSKRGRRIQV
jgi:hypothetical protein